MYKKIAIIMIVLFSVIGSFVTVSLAQYTFSVGLECNYAPFNWTQTDDSNGAVAIKGGGGFCGGYDVEIAKAIEEIFDVKVQKVNTISVRGRKRRQGLSSGYTPAWKKAIVTLTGDSKGIEFFESMT